MQGRLQGKRLHARYFLDVVLEHATEGCNYLLAVDVDMNTVDGYAMSSWSSGYGDFVMQPDLSTLRPVPWQPGTAMVLADLHWEDGSPVVASPRQILAPADGAAGRRAAWPPTSAPSWSSSSSATPTSRPGRAGYRDLTPANQYNVDYSLLGTARIEPLLRRIRNDMTGAGLRRRVGQGRVQPRPARDRLPLRRGAGRTCDGHVDLQERRQGDRRAGGHAR